jgi:hypothetical protein
VRQGDLYWYTFAPPAGRRPVIVLTRSSAIGYLHAVVVAPVSTTVRGIPSEVVVDAPDGVTQRSVISLDNCIFRRMPSGESGASRPLNPDHGVQRIRGKPSTNGRPAGMSGRHGAEC